jgi:Rod binding domain-containing protein
MVIRPDTPPPALSQPRAHADPAAARRVAEAFEGQVIGALLQPMFEGLSSSGPFSGGAAEAQWRPMLVEEIGRSVARAGGLGIAAAVLREVQR